MPEHEPMNPLAPAAGLCVSEPTSAGGLDLVPHQPNTTALSDISIADLHTPTHRPQRCWTRAWLRLPYQLDLVTGSQTSWPVTLAAFTLMLLLVMGSLFNLLFGANTNLDWQLEAAGNPAPVGVFGAPFPPFAVQLTTGDKLPLGGYTASVLAVMIDEAPLQALILEDLYFLRTVDCYDFLTSPEGYHTHQDALLCRAAVAGETATTGADGRATFTNFRVCSGLPGAYLMVITVRGPFDLVKSVSAYATLQPSLIGVQAALASPPPARFGDQVDVEVNLMFSNRTAGNVTPVGAEVAVLSVGLDGRQWLLSDTLRRKLLMPNLAGPKVTLLANPLAAIQLEHLQVSPDPGLINVSLTLRGVQLLSGSPTVYLAVHCMGTLAMIPNPLVDGRAGQAPDVLQLAFQLQPRVAVVELRRRPSPTELQEGTMFAVQPVVCVTDAAGAAVPGVVVMARLTVLAGWEVDVATLGPLAPTAPQRLTAPFSAPTNASGCAAFDGLGTAAVGPVGPYAVDFQCEGVGLAAPWNFSVVSALGKVAVHINSLPFSDQAWANETIVVGQDWPSVPSLALSTTAGRPLPGKTAALRPASPGIAVVGEALPSNAEGWVFFASVFTAYARQSGTYSFEIVVDQQVVIRFTRAVVLPSNNTADGCAFVHILAAPRCVVAGQPLAGPGRPTDRCPGALVVQPVSATGDPVEAAVHLRMVDAQAIALLANLTTGEPLPSSNGLSYTENPVPSLAGLGFGDALSGPVTLQVGCGGDADPLRGDWVELQVLRRVHRVELTGLQDRRLATARVTDASGAPVPGVTVTGRVLQQPAYTEAYLGYLNANSSQTDTQGIAVLGVTFSEQVVAEYLYGDFVVYAEAEGVPAVAPVIFSFPNPVTSIEVVQPLIPASSNATDNATAGPVLVPFFATLSGLVRVAGPGSAGASVAVVVERCDPAVSLCRPDDRANWSPVDFLTQPKYFGKLTAALWPGLDAFIAPWLAPGNRSGDLVPVTSAILGLRPSLLFRFAYAYGGIILARESGVFTSRDRNTLQLTQPPSPQVIPGKVFGRPPVVQVSGPDGRPALVAFVVAGVLDQQYYSVGFSADGVTGVAFRAQPRVTFAQLSFLPDSDLRQYQLVFYCPGAEPLVGSTVQATNQAYQLRFVAPLRSAATVGGSALPAKIAAVLSDGTPVPHMAIRCSLRMTAKAKAALLPYQVLNSFPFRGCYGAAGNCGQLLVVGAQGVTNADGVAQLSLVVVSGPSVSYEVVCAGKVLTGDAILQVAAQARAQQVDQDVAEKFGFAAAGRALQREVAALGVQANPGLLDFVTDGLFEWGSAQLKLTSNPISVTNEVGSVEVLAQPRLFPRGYVPPITLKPVFTLWPLRFAQQPRVRVLDRHGRPVSDKTVLPVAFPTDTPLHLNWSRAQVTDSNGTLQFTDLEAISGATGQYYRIVFFCDGVPSFPSDKFLSLPPQALTQQWDNLRYALLCLFFMLLPVFISNFPGASPWWLLLAACSMAGTGVFGYFLYVQELVARWERTTTWVKASVIYLFIAYGALGLGLGHLVFKVARDWRGGRRAAPAPSGLAKAAEGYHYARWLATLRLTPAEVVQHLRAYEQHPEEVRHPPPPELLRHIVPLRYYLTAGLCISLLSLFAMVVVYFYLWLEDWLRSMLAVLPSLSEAEAEQQRLVQSELLQWLQEWLFQLIEANPSLYWLYTVVDFLSGIDPVGMLASLYKWVSDLHWGLAIAGYLALACTLSTTVLHIFLLWRSCRNNLLRIRKGKVPHSLLERTSHNAAETYPAHQLMHLLVGFVFQYVLFLLILLVFCTSPLRWLVFRYWGMSIVLLIITYTVRYVLVLTLQVIALDGLEVRHPRLYQLWASINLVFLSVLAATLLVIIRWVKTITVLSIYFIRLDVQIFPGRLGKIDQPYLAFWSMLCIEHTYHNPLKNVFLGYLLQYRAPWTDLHPSIGCMLLVLQQQNDRGIRHLSRWRRKWWLTVTLARNPQLRGHRKHALPPRIGPGLGPKDGLLAASASQLAELQGLAAAQDWAKSPRRRALYFTLLLLFAAVFVGWMALVVRWSASADS